MDFKFLLLFLPPDLEMNESKCKVHPPGLVNVITLPGKIRKKCNITDLTRRIGLACAVMTSLKRIWSDKRLTLDTKLRTYQTRVLSVLLYAADTWTLLSADVRTGCFPTEVSETAAWNAMVRPSPK